MSFIIWDMIFTNQKFRYKLQSHQYLNRWKVIWDYFNAYFCVYSRVKDIVEGKESRQTEGKWWFYNEHWKVH